MIMIMIMIIIIIIIIIVGRIARLVIIVIIKVHLLVMHIWSEDMTSEVEQRPTLVTGHYGRHRRQYGPQNDQLYNRCDISPDDHTIHCTVHENRKRQ